MFPDDIYERAGLIKDGGDWKTKGNLLGTVDSNKLTPYEYYGSLDDLGRCTYACGLLGEETMPQNGNSFQMCFAMKEFPLKRSSGRIRRDIPGRTPCFPVIFWTEWI